MRPKENAICRQELSPKRGGGGIKYSMSLSSSPKRVGKKFLHYRRERECRRAIKKYSK